MRVIRGIVGSMWKAAQPLRLSKKERELLESFARAGSTPQKIVLRIRIVLRSADGVANHRVARELRTSRPTVLRWRRRFEQEGPEGLLEDAPRPGRKRRLTAEKEEAIVNATLYSKPAGATHWTVRTLARAQRVVWAQFPDRNPPRVVHALSELCSAALTHDLCRRQALSRHQSQHQSRGLRVCVYVRSLLPTHGAAANQGGGARAVL